jgi:hypothetical protein
MMIIMMMIQQKEMNKRITQERKILGKIIKKRKKTEKEIGNERKKEGKQNLLKLETTCK